IRSWLRSMGHLRPRTAPDNHQAPKQPDPNHAVIYHSGYHIHYHRDLTNRCRILPGYTQCAERGLLFLMSPTVLMQCLLVEYNPLELEKHMWRSDRSQQGPKR